MLGIGDAEVAPGRDVAGVEQACGRARACRTRTTMQWPTSATRRSAPIRACGKAVAPDREQRGRDVADDISREGLSSSWCPPHCFGETSSETAGVEAGPTRLLGLPAATLSARHSGATRSVEPGIHSTTEACGPMDSGLSLREPGMTAVRAVAVREGHATGPALRRPAPGRGSR